MKRLGTFFIILTLLFVSSGCSSQKEQGNAIVKDVREDVWNQLDSATKEQIKGTWKEGTVTKEILSEKMGDISDKTYIGKEIYVVDFPTLSLALPNNRIFFASIDSHKIIGLGLVD